MVNHASDMISNIILTNIDDFTDKVGTGLPGVTSHLLISDHAIISLMLFPGLFILFHDSYQFLLHLVEVLGVSESQLQEFTLLAREMVDKLKILLQDYVDRFQFFLIHFVQVKMNLPKIQKLDSRKNLGAQNYIGKILT